MKKYLFSIIFLLVSYVGFSQKGLSYQAVILDPSKIEIPGQDISGQPFVNGDVWMKFSIYNGSTLQFEEVQKTKTDEYGLVNLIIGSVSSASFNALVWDASQKSLQVFVSFNQGASYTKVSDQKLNYNPYALYADTAGKLGGILGIAGGGTGATTATDARVNLGLGNLDNTSDAAKPISTATKAALDLKANVADVNAALALKANTSDVNTSLALKANNTDMTATLAAKADTGAIKTFVVTQVAAATIPDADASTKGKIQLAGDLAGTADTPTVPGLALKANTADVTTALDLKANAADVTSALALKANANNVVTSLNLKENISNKSTNVSIDGASDTKYPSVKAVKTYVDAQLTGVSGAATISDADANTKGKIQLTGDLSGTAAAPTVPGLTLKANIADLLSLTSIVNSNTSSITAETTRASAAELVLTNNVSSNTASITANTNSIASLNTSVASNTASITANTSDIASLNTNVSSNTASITANTTAISLRATTASPSFTGIPTAPTATSGTNTTQLATTAFVTSAISTVNASTISGTVPIANGGTGATTATTALANLTGTQTKNTILAGPASSLVTLASYDGSSTSGFTIGGGVTVDNTVGNPGSSIKTVVGSGATFLYKDFGQNFKNKIIEFNIRLTRGTGGIAIGANSSGGQGVGLVINAGTSNQNGLRTADTWGYPPRGYDTYTFNTNTWYSIKIITDNGLPGGVSWYVNGTLVGSNSSVAIGDGTYFGFTTDYTGTEVYFDNLTIKDNSGLTGAATFRALVADDIPTLNQNTTGNAATATSATSFTGNLSGDVSGTQSSTVVSKINGTSLAGLSTGILKNTTSTGVPTIAVAGTDYQAPLTLTTTGTGAATLSGSTLNIPTVATTVNASSISGTVAVANGGTGVTSATGTGSVVLSNSPSLTGTPVAPTAAAGTNTTQLATTAFVTSAISTVNASTISGTVPIANGGTGATTASTALANLTGTKAKNTIFAGPSSSIVTLASYDGSSLSGFSLFSNGVSVDGTGGNPGSSIKSVGGNSKAFYQNFGQNFKNKIIEFDIRLTNSAGTIATGGIAIGARSDGGAGIGLGIITGTNNRNGLGTADTWQYPPLGPNTYTFNQNTWYSIKIISDNGTAGGVSWYVNGTLVGNSGSLTIGNDTYFGFTAGYDNTTVYFDNITIKDISGLPATPSFRALVADDIPSVPLTTGVTGTLSVTNGGTGVTSATGSGSVVLSTSPTLVTPNLGTPSTLVGTNISGTAANLTAGNVTTNANLTGDVTSLGNATTLAASGVVSGTYGSSTAIPTFTVDSKGRITVASNTSITAGVNTLTYTTASSYANGGTISGTTLTLAAANETNPGLISTGAQTIAGAKTFNGNLSAPTVTTPIYASTPQALTSGSTISWNPANGLNANVTLNQNSTLSFSSTPSSGSYGTLVITQDATGGRTITLPSTDNKVLGSTSTTSIALSTAGGSKDILNFYYDGTNFFWNIGQGYGTASTSSQVNLTSSVTGTLPVANGGTGVTTLTGLVKGNGTNVMTAAVAGTDYQAPLTLTTTGTGAATISGTTLNIPTPNDYTLTTASASTLGGVKVGNNLSIDGSGVLSANINASSISGTVAVANGGTGVTSSTGTGSVVLSASPALTGTPTAPTATSGNNTTQIATTAFVTAAVAAGGGGGSSTYTTGLNSSLGGYVFYVTPDGKHGLVAETNEFDSPLYNANDKLKDPTYHSTDGKNFMDWRVPTLYELTLMYNMKTTLNMNNSNIYWSSTWWGGYSANSFFNKRMSDGVEYDNGSDQSKKIKAVRTF
jgi:hypothetical protein